MPHAIAALGDKAVVAHSNKVFVVTKDSIESRFEVPTGHLDNIIVSPDQSKILGVNHADKAVVVFNTSLEEIKRFPFPKRPSSLAFKSTSSSESHVLVADKFGDVYDLDLDGTVHNDKDEFILEPILGHVSMLLKIAVDGDKILTADRDEHIKISSTPSPFNILGFCFGHTQYVSDLCIADQGTLLSAGGDSFVVKWSLDTFEETGRLDLSTVFPEINGFNVLRLEKYQDNKVLCIVQEVPVILIINVETMVAEQYTLPDQATDLAVSTHEVWVSTKDSLLFTDLEKTEAFPEAFGDSEVHVLMQHEMRKRAEH